MKRSWDSVVGPLLEAARPMTVVEIGSFEGENTRNLLAWCEGTGAVLHVIDPAPRYDPDEWAERHGGRLVFHKALSLEALPEIPAFDAVLVDGDHNWYTVYNELRTIERLCAERGDPFPLVMLHDVFWPTARRDQYYVPETIPDAHRQPIGTGGVRPDSGELLEEGGFNAGQPKALAEGGPRNGVLTAIEDFLEETSLALELLTIPGFHGIGVLTGPEVRERPEVAEVLAAWDLPPIVRAHIERLEAQWLDSEVYRRELHARQARLRARVKDLQGRAQGNRGGAK